MRFIPVNVFEAKSQNVIYEPGLRLLGGVQSNQTQNEWQRNSHQTGNSNWNLLFVGHLVSISVWEGEQSFQGRVR